MTDPLPGSAELPPSVVAGSGAACGTNPTLTGMQAAVIAMAHLEASGIRGPCDLAIVTAAGTPARHPERIAQAIREITGAKLIVGCSGGRVWTEAAAPMDDGVCVLVVHGTHAVSAMAPQLGRDPAGAARHLVRSLALETPASATNRMVMVLFDPRHFQPGPFLSAMRDDLPPGTPVLGGGCSVEDGRTWLMTASATDEGLNTEVMEDAVIALCLPHCDMSWGLSQSFQPITPLLTVTGASQRALHTLDGQPAWQVLSSIVPPEQLLDDAQRWHTITAGLPARTPDQRTHHQLIPLERVSPAAGTIELATPLPIGTRLSFTLRDPVRATRDLRMMLRQLRQRSNASGFGLHIDATDRGSAMFGAERPDIGDITSTFPDLPLIGWQTPRQLAPLDGFPAAHFSSAALLLMS